MAEMQLGDREILLGGEPEQRDASRRVGGDAEPLEVHVGEVGLGARVVLVGRLAIPLQRGRVVLNTRTRDVTSRCATPDEPRPMRYKWPRLVCARASPCPASGSHSS